MTLPDFMTSTDRGCAPGRANPDFFFASPKTAETIEAGQAALAREQQAVARWVCRNRCPFTDECFIWAETHDEQAGIWGGVDMGSKGERERARLDKGVDQVIEVPVAEADEVLVERVLASGAVAFRKLSTEQRETVVRAGVKDGMSVTKLSQKFRCAYRTIEKLAGDALNSFDEQVRRHYHDGKADPAIAMTLDCDVKRVHQARVRLGLPALFGPGGRPRRRISDAQKTRHEQVPA